MKFRTTSTREKLTVVLADIRSEKQLNIFTQKLKERKELISENDIVSEIKNRVAKHFDCAGCVELELDGKAESTIKQIAAYNKSTFEAE